MGRFPWGQAQSKHSSDKLQAITHDWFSKDNAEPSRQALDDLRREHSFGSGTSGGSPRHQGRSRTNTTTSSISFYARSVSDGSNDVTSRPSSRQSFVDSGLPLGERHDNPAKSLLSKGSRILKRQTSKLSLLPSSTEDKGIVGLERRVGQGSPAKGLQRQLTLGSQRDDLKKNISTPFAFQHLSHGNQAHFQSLDNVTKTRLTSEFNAIQADQRPDDQIRGITVADLPTQGTESEVRLALDEPTSPTTSAIPYLPTTPPRPQPPPKDPLVSPYSPSDIRLSRSMENFSRPTRLSMVATDLPASSASSTRLSALGSVCRNSISVKPLPQVPTIVHAVSTTDDVALPLRTAPLPSPPKTVMEAVEEENTDQVTVKDVGGSPVLGLDPAGLIQHRRRSQSSGEIDFDMSYYYTAPVMENPEGPAVVDDRGSKLKHRISIGVKAIQLEDWEDAIDYSWDHAAELEEVDDRADTDTTVDQSRPPSIRQETFLNVGQGAIDDTSSSASTPLMMHGAHQTCRLRQDEQQSSLSRCLDEEPSSPLLGLGIGSIQTAPVDTVAQSDAGHVEQGAGRFESTDVFRRNFIRSPNSCMSKSSSQESIILSIASSIIGTHRSSNSSASLSDFAHLANFGGSLDNLKLEFDGSGLPVEKRNRDGSQETIREESQSTSATTSTTLSTRYDFPVAFTTSPHPRHDRGASTSQLPIPQRKSSIPGTDPCRAHTGRKRAGTATSRPRGNTRVSYSLFPTT